MSRGDFMTSKPQQPEPREPTPARPRDVLAMKTQAEELERAGRYQDALTHAEEAASQIETAAPSLASHTLLLLARLRRELARHDDAEEAALQAIVLLSGDKQSPDYASGLAELGRIYEAQG